MREPVMVETLHSIRLTVGLVGLAIAVVLPIGMYQSRGGDVTAAVVSSLFGMVIATLYFKVTRISLDPENVMVTKRWIFRYKNLKIRVSHITKLLVKHDFSRGGIYEIHYPGSKVKFEWIELNAPDRIFETLSRMTGIPVERGV